MLVMSDLQLYVYIACILGVISLMCWLQDIFFPEENEDDQLEAKSITMLWLGAFIAWVVVIPLFGIIASLLYYSIYHWLF